MRTALSIASVLWLVGCSDDAAPLTDSGPGDTTDGNACASMIVGELLDLDSSDASFKGIPGAMVSIEGVPATTVTTPPNGRLMVCVPTVTDPVRLTIDGPNTYLDSSVYIEPETLEQQAAAPISLRSFTDERAATFYGEQGLAFDSALGHILVQQTIDISDLSIDRTHDTTLAASANGSTLTWAPGAAGRYVLFPNVSVAQATATLSGDAGETHVVPVAAGKLTIVVLQTIFL